MTRDEKIKFGIAVLILLTTVPPIVQTMKSIAVREINFERVKNQPFTYEKAKKQTLARIDYMTKSGYTREEIREAIKNDLKFTHIIVNQPTE